MAASPTNWLRVKLLGALALLAAALAYIGYRLATAPQWQQFHTERFWQSLTQARLSYLLLAAALIFSSYYLRSLRWQVFMQPVKQARIGNLLVSTLVGFSAVALLGRPGEVVRPLLIARKEQVPIVSQLGAWTLERVFDSLTISALLGAAFLFFPPQFLSGSTGAQLLTGLKMAGVLLWVGSFGTFAVLALLRFRAALVWQALRWLLRPLPKRFQRWIQTAMEHFSAGIASMGSAASLLASLILSLLLWGAILLAFWTILHAPLWPIRWDWGAVVLVLGASVAGSLASLPAVGGGTQVATLLVMTQLFAVPLDVATSLALLLWTWTFMLVLIPGIPLAAREGLGWKGLRNLARMKWERESD